MCLAGNIKSQGGPGNTSAPPNTTPPPEDNYYAPDFNELTDYVDKDSFRMLINEWRQKVIDEKPIREIKAWWDHVKRLHGPRIVGHEECIKSFPLFFADNFSSGGFDGTIEGDNCFK